MSMINAIKGTRDFLPGEIHKLQHIERTALETAASFGFYELRTPVFEYTELFCRGVGDTTDVVQKEMYTFNDKGDRSVTLRPEGTAGAVRAFLEHGLFNEPLPQKLSYLTSCYRYEKPQSGRWREFHQFGVEALGSASHYQDAEVIMLACAFFDALCLGDLQLEINSIGCPECRKKYLNALSVYFEGCKGDLCETCLGRLERNPMRILDCKSPVCSSLAANAPVVLDYLCEECGAHFEGLRQLLDAADIPYIVNPHIVRGLDYYTKTVFEFVSQNEKTKGLVCGGGGRYDGLVEELGGSPLPACGFGLGLERILLAMEESDAPFPQKPVSDLALVSAGDAAQKKAFLIADELRRDGFSVVIDTMQRSVKAQMKYAGKCNVRYTAVIGDNELESNTVRLKNMQSSLEQTVTISDFASDFENALISDSLDGICDAELN